MRRTFLGILTFLVLSLSPDSVVFAACPCDYFEDLPLRNVRGRSLVCSEVEKDGMTTRQLSAYRRNDRWSLGADDLGPGDSMQCYTAHTRNNGNADLRNTSAIDVTPEEYDDCVNDVAAYVAAA